MKKHLFRSFLLLLFVIIGVLFHLFNRNLILGLATINLVVAIVAFVALIISKKEKVILFTKGVIQASFLYSIFTFFELAHLKGYELFSLSLLIFAIPIFLNFFFKNSSGILSFKRRILTERRIYTPRGFLATLFSIVSVMIFIFLPASDLPDGKPFYAYQSEFIFFTFIALAITLSAIFFRRKVNKKTVKIILSNFEVGLLIMHAYLLFMSLDMFFFKVWGDWNILGLIIYVPIIIVLSLIIGIIKALKYKIKHRNSKEQYPSP